jgi:hypothetical protein
MNSAAVFTIHIAKPAQLLYTTPQHEVTGGLLSPNHDGSMPNRNLILLGMLLPLLEDLSQVRDPSV